MGGEELKSGGKEGGRRYISTVESQPLLIDTNIGVTFEVMWQH